MEKAYFLTLMCMAIGVGVRHGIIAKCGTRVIIPLAAVTAILTAGIFFNLAPANLLPTMLPRMIYVILDFTGLGFLAGRFYGWVAPRLPRLPI